MGKAAATSLAAAVVGAGLSVALDSAYRCIDTPAFFYPQALAYAWVGAGLLLFGGALLGRGPRTISVGAVAVGVLLLAFALTGPPFKACGQFQFTPTSPERPLLFVAAQIIQP